MTTLSGLDRAAIARAARNKRSMPGPWSWEQLIRLMIGDAVALALLLAGAWEAHTEHTTRGALSWLNVAVVGFLLAGVSNALWLLRGRVMLKQARTVVLGDVAECLTPLNGASDVPMARVAAGAVVVRGLSRIHRPDCAFVLGRVTEPAPQRVTASLDRCEVCEP